MVPALLLPSTNTPVPTATNSPTATPAPTETAVPTAVNAVACSCTDDLNDCTGFDTPIEAQACYAACLPVAGDIHFLDGEQDAPACPESAATIFLYRDWKRPDSSGCAQPKALTMPSISDKKAIDRCGRWLYFLEEE